MVPFLQLAAEKKNPFLVWLKQIFGPSYFVKALIEKQPFQFWREIQIQVLAILL